MPLRLVDRLIAWGYWQLYWLSIQDSPLDLIIFCGLIIGTAGLAIWACS